MKTVFQRHKEHFFPLIPEPYLSAEKVFLDLSSPHSLDKTRLPGRVYLGNYGEERGIYTQDLFHNRCIHLGLDIELPAGTPLFLPLEGVVVGAKNHADSGNYGPTLIFQHELDGEVFYSLYGHLSIDSLLQSPKGKYLPTGHCFAQIGTPDENGGWPSHVHLQLIKNWHSPYREQEDYPGVCSKEEAEFYLENCPDPHRFAALSDPRERP